MRWVTRGPRPSVDAAVRAGFATALLISILVGVFAYTSLVGLVAANDLLQRSYLILAKLEVLKDSFLGAETASLRYSATGDEKQLASYGTRTSAIDQAAAELRELTAEEPSQRWRYRPEFCPVFRFAMMGGRSAGSPRPIS